MGNHVGGELCIPVGDSVCSAPSRIRAGVSRSAVEIASRPGRATATAEVFRLPVAYMPLQDSQRPAVSFGSCDRVESAGGAGELTPAEVSVVRGLGDIPR